jgi:hypothetical protein
LLSTREGLRVAVTVDAVRNVKRLLEGDERDEWDRQRTWNNEKCGHAGSLKVCTWTPETVLK